MPEEPTQPPASVPPAEPPVGNGNPSIAFRAEVIPVEFFDKGDHDDVRARIQAVAAKDSCCLKILEQIQEVETGKMPSAGDLGRQKRKIQEELEKLRKLQAARGKRAVKLRVLEAQLAARVEVIRGRVETRLVISIRQRAGLGTQTTDLVEAEAQSSPRRSFRVSSENAAGI